jgi:CPA2 family monovalent cation:H+ antiporter-2
MLLLKDIIIILFLAVVIIFITARLKLPPVIGFLFTGILIGPSALHLVRTVSEIEILSEIGIVILMFTIGLEFSLDKIKVMKKYFMLFGGLQVIGSWAVFSLLLYGYGLSLQQFVFGGFILSLSSTAIILKLLQDSNDLDTPSGMKMIGILLFQDVAIIPFLIILPSLHKFGRVLTPISLLKIILPIIGVIIIFLVSRKLVPKLFALILSVRIPELLMVSVFVLLFGTAFLTHKLGASLAIGAFIAGAAISDSDFAHQINTEIIPSRHIFNSIFFISIGMFINLPFLFNHITKVIVITLLIIAIKILIVLLIFFIARYPNNEGMITAFGLAHIGEFSFILLKVSQEQNLFTQELYQMLISASVLSMFSIPFALKLGNTIAGYHRFKKKITSTHRIESLKKHTIIAGFGINGQNIARILKLLHIPYAILEINPMTVRKYKALGEPIQYGDIDREDNLKTMGINKASLLVIAISDIDACIRAIKIAKKVNPELKIIARSNFLSQVDPMYQLGADLVLSQDMETSLVFIHYILKFYHMPDHVARVQTDLLRKEHYSFFMRKKTMEAWKVALLDYIEQDNELFFITATSKHISQKIETLKPFTYPDMKIIGVIRHNEIITEKVKNMVIEPYDTLIFSGNHEQVFNALKWMEEHN